jgi:hypothetical protein
MQPTAAKELLDGRNDFFCKFCFANFQKIIPTTQLPLFGSEAAVLWFSPSYLH